MLPNYVGNTELQKYAEHSPPKAQMILESVVTTASDIKDTKADWDGADSVAGWTTLEGGGATPTGSDATKISYATGTNDAVTSLPGITGATVGAAVVQWFAANIEATTFDKITARLDPNADGGGVEVTTWTAQLFRVSHVDVYKDQAELWDLEALTPVLRATAGAVVAEVTFDIPRPKSIGDGPTYEDVDSRNNSLLSGGRPVTILVIGALEGNGEVAGNVAWIGNTAVSQATSGNHFLYRYNLLEFDDSRAAEGIHRKQVLGSAPVAGLPRFTLNGKTYSSQTITFDSTNPPDLGAVPTATVEFVVEHEQPGGSSGQAQVRNDADSAWVDVNDGDTTDDLAGVGKRQTYEMRYTATPSSDGSVTTTVRRLGVREITRETLDDLGRIGNPTYSLDPRTFKAAIPTLSLEFSRDLRDHRDYASELFSENHAGNIEFRVWYGHPDLDRQYWIHKDTFRLHNYDSAADPIVVETIHPLALTKKTIPVGSTAGQVAITYAGSTDTVASVYADLLDRAGLQARYKGVLLGTTNTANIAKVIARPRPMKEEMDRIAFIEGGTIIPSAGRLKWQRMFTTTGGYVNSPVYHFEDVEPVSVSPHLDHRIVSYRAPYGFSEALDGGRGGYAGAVFQTSTSAASKLGHAALGGEEELDDEIAQWLIGDSTSVGSVYAAAIARRTVGTQKAGVLLVKFRPPYPAPWLELGDPVTVPTDRFVGRGVETDRALRGWANITGPIVEHDLNGTEFTVWGLDIDPILPSPDDINITYGSPKFESISLDTARYPEAFDDAGGGWVLALQGYRPYVNYVVTPETKSFTALYRRQSGSTSYTTNTYIHSTTANKAGRVAITPIVKDSTRGLGAIQRNVTFTFTPYLGTTGSGKAGPSILLRPSTSTIQGHGVSLFDGTTQGDVAGGRLFVGSGLTLARTSDGFPLIKLST